MSDPELDGPLPVLLAGDLNAAPDSPELRPVLDVMVDSWKAAGGDSHARTLRSEHPFAPPEATKQLDRRIDYALIRQSQPATVQVRCALTIAEPLDGHHPSDHDAVVTDVVLTDR